MARDTNPQEDAFYTDDGPLGVRYIAPGYDQAQPLAGPWITRSSKEPATHEEIERVLTAPRPAGKAYRSATYMEPQAFAHYVAEQHKKEWLAIYKMWRDQKARVGQRFTGHEHLEKAIEQLWLYHRITPEQADQLIEE